MAIYSIIETEQFIHWLGRLKDRTTRARLQLRLRKASLGEGNKSSQTKDVERAKALAQD